MDGWHLSKCFALRVSCFVQAQVFSDVHCFVTTSTHPKQETVCENSLNRSSVVLIVDHM